MRPSAPVAGLAPAPAGAVTGRTVDPSLGPATAAEISARYAATAASE